MNREPEALWSASFEIQPGNLQRKNDTAKPRAEHDLDSSPGFPGQDIQVTRKRDARQKIRKKDINSAGKDQLIENAPVRYIPTAKIDDILLYQSKRPERTTGGY